MAFLIKASMPGKNGIDKSTSGKQKKPRSLCINLKSQAHDKIAPLPNAWPLIAAITGIGNSNKRLNTASIECIKPLTSANFCAFNAGISQSVSMPKLHDFSLLEVITSALCSGLRSISSRQVKKASAKAGLWRF